MSGVAALDVRDLSIAYDGRTVLDKVSLQVNKGELFGLIGLNGVGKTSMIKAALDLRTQDGGVIMIDGLPSDMTEARKDLAFLPERFDPPLFMTGLEFIRFSARLYGNTVKDEDARQLATELDLDPSYLSKRANTYSKGMRQKLGLIATFLSGCSIVVLDEPMSGLDPKARVLVKDLLSRFHKEGRTIFLSSHILSDLDELCDRIAVLHARHFQFVGKPEDLRKETKEANLERAFLNLINTTDTSQPEALKANVK